MILFLKKVYEAEQISPKTIFLKVLFIRKTKYFELWLLIIRVKYCIADDIKSIFNRQTGCWENSATYNINRNQCSATYTFIKNS